MFKIIKNFNWIILSSFLCIFMGIVTFLTFINEGFVPLTDQNLQIRPLNWLQFTNTTTQLATSYKYEQFTLRQLNWP